METKKYKTNLKCGGCVAKITEGMDALVGEGNWEVDLESADRILKVEGKSLDSGQILKVLEEAGFEGKEVKGFLRKVFG